MQINSFFLNQHDISTLLYHSNLQQSLLNSVKFSQIHIKLFVLQVLLNNIVKYMISLLIKNWTAFLTRRRTIGAAFEKEIHLSLTFMTLLTTLWKSTRKHREFHQCNDSCWNSESSLPVTHHRFFWSHRTAVICILTHLGSLEPRLFEQVTRRWEVFWRTMVASVSLLSTLWGSG